MPNSKNKSLKITVFSDGHRPKENYNGLIYLSKKDNLNQIYMIDKLFDKRIDIKSNIKQRVKIYSKFNYLMNLKNFIINIIYIYNSDLVFGSFNILLRLILCILGWHGYYICVPPGKITKATGYFKQNRLNFKIIIKNILSNKFLKTNILAVDIFDKYYLSLSNSYMLNNIIISPYPKHIFINKQLAKSNKEYKNKILFAPTERSKGYLSPIFLFLESEKNRIKINEMGYEIIYSQHIHDGNYDSQIFKEVKLFEGNWEEISILVTDYSSIGSDFLISGGLKLIYLIKDQFKFSQDQGIGPFFDNEIKKAKAVKDENHLLEAIYKFSLDKNNLIRPFNEDLLNNYFINIYRQIKNQI